MRGSTAASAFSIVVPMLNEAAVLPELLAHLRAVQQQQRCECILVDGGSSDDSVALASAAGFTVLTSPPGRARQMNVGAEQASGEVLLFLHADTRLPADALAAITHALAGGRQRWGRFDVRIDGRSPLLRLVGWAMNWRSRLSGIATGDQAIFVQAALFRQLGGFPCQPLMEDIEFSRRAKAVSAPLCLRQRVLTSGRRWESRGVCRTILLMWRLRWQYWRGVPADQLVAAYR